MTTTYFFSHDEDGLNFFDDVFSLRRNTPRIEDCYVYVGEDGLKCEKFAYDQDEWQEYRDESVNALDWIEKENEKLKKQADAENTADMINKLNEEYDELNNKHNSYVKELENSLPSVATMRHALWLWQEWEELLDKSTGADGKITDPAVFKVLNLIYKDV